jgi:hypothetical protein
VRAVQKFFDDGVMSPGINDTAIVLIPKGNNPEELKDFRPISLCNLIYKAYQSVWSIGYDLCSERLFPWSKVHLSRVG